MKTPRETFVPFIANTIALALGERNLLMLIEAINTLEIQPSTLLDALDAQLLRLKQERSALQGKSLSEFSRSEISHLHIRSRNPSPTQRCKGQETFVHVVMKDGTEHFVPHLQFVSWYVDGRTGYCTAVLRSQGISIDADAQLGTKEQELQGQVESLTRLLAESEVARERAEAEARERRERAYGESE